MSGHHWFLTPTTHNPSSYLPAILKNLKSKWNSSQKVNFDSSLNRWWPIKPNKSEEKDSSHNQVTRTFKSNTGETEGETYISTNETRVHCNYPADNKNHPRRGLLQTTLLEHHAREKTNCTTAKALPWENEYLAPPWFKWSVLLPSAASFREFLSYRCSSHKLQGMWQLPWEKALFS